jgi:hypothetical protein
MYMDNACSTHGENMNAYRVLIAEQENKRILGIILKWMLGKLDVHTGWIHLAQNKDQWRALMNTVMNLFLL